MQEGADEGPGNAADILSPSSLRVLVCDSKASARQDLVRLLRECSYQVWRAAAPEAARRRGFKALQRGWLTEGPVSCRSWT